MICRDLQQLPRRTIRLCVCVRVCLCVCVCVCVCVSLAVTTVGDHSEPSKHLSWPEAHTHTHSHTHTALCFLSSSNPSSVQLVSSLHLSINIAYRWLSSLSVCLLFLVSITRSLFLFSTPPPSHTLNCLFSSL